MARKRFVQAGLGGRSKMFTNAVLDNYKDSCEMVGYCDNNAGRVKLAVEQAGEKGARVAGYADTDFDRMIAEARPDCVIVTTRDCFHDKYICRALELGCDVITEKPMTTDEVKCQRVLDAVRTSGRKCRVTFNYRYSPPRTQVKDLLMGGVIGEVLSVDFHWLLDTHHGTDYFRRWHRNKVNSGGLMVHKATHHFDLVNWWLSTVPQTVFALGHRRFYTPRTAERLGLGRRGERCHTCAAADVCTFKLDLAGNPNLKRLYLDNERYDGYFRDQCVFSDKIDIEDSMNVVVAYENGVKMSYSLNAFCAWEGYMVAFNGTEGRLEHTCQEKVYINADGSVPGALKKEGTHIRIFPQRRAAYEVELWTGTGGHGGGDDPMLDDLFATAPPADRYLRAADHRSGAWSILTGVAANKSMACGQPVTIGSLVDGLGLPEYPAMPSGAEPLKIPAPQE
jgi:predicted dehydrogenase